MLLVIDIGNTNIVGGLYEGRTLAHTFRISTLHTRTADEYWALLANLVSLQGVQSSAIHAAIIASVVPQLTEVLAGAVRRCFAREPLVVGRPGFKTGISVLYESPRDVGADRIVNAVAAFDRVHAGVIVVDFGTATTFDCISPKAEYLGGVIVPGVQVSLEGLLSHAAKLRPIELAVPPHIVGRTTAHSLQSGVIFGYAALVDGLVARLETELGFPCEVIATGGLASLIIPHSRSVKTIDPNLTLEGLRLLYERNTHSDGST